MMHSCRLGAARRAALAGNRLASRATWPQGTKIPTRGRLTIPAVHQSWSSMGCS